MDGLISEATDLILSNNHYFTKGLCNDFKCERWQSSPAMTDSSSITLLRMSITKTLKERRSQSEVIDSITPKRKKSRQRRGSYSGKTKVDVQLLDPELETLHQKERKQNNFKVEQKKLDVPENALTRLFTEEHNSEKIVPPQSDLNQAKSNEVEINSYDTTATITDESVHPNPHEIGLKLARRNFSDNIFENCSTYSIPCSDVLPENEIRSTYKEHFGDARKFSKHKTTKPGSDASYIADKKISDSADNDISSDDQISLRDSFFVNVNNDDNTSQNSIFTKGSDCSSVSRKSSRFSISKENNFFASDEIKSNSDAERWQMKSERKLSKKEKKRQKRSKSNEVPMYNCPKCGVSYILSDNASRSAACCLHCDFWKSVEPVFLKREKQPWNTCLIC